MSSPCPPSTNASISSGETFSSIEMKALNLEASRMPPMPMTRLQENSVVCHASCDITSIGFVTMIMMVWGDVLAISALTALTMLALACRRSLRDMPGFRARPAVTTIRGPVGSIIVAVCSPDGGRRIPERTCLCHIEGLPLRHPADYVKQDDIGNTGLHNELSCCSADIPCTNYGYFFLHGRL